MIWSAQGEESDRSELREEYGGQAVLEVPVLCFVMEYAHPANRADAAADDGEQEQRFFRYAPCSALCTALVRAEGQERGEVDEQQVRQRREKQLVAHASSLARAAAVFAARRALL